MATRRRRIVLRRAVLTFFAIAAAPLLLPNAGSADEPARQGWWWQANPGNGAPAPPGPPDVPGDGLYVQGGPSGPVALSAVQFELADGQKPATLTLHLIPAQNAVTGAAPAPAPAPVPVPGQPPAPAPAPAPDGTASPLPPPGVQACVIASGTINAEQGGPMADAPDTTGCTPIPGTVDATAGTATFNLSSVTTTGSTLALAILPASATDRAAFSHPGSDALMVDASPADTSADTSTDSSFSPSTETATAPADSSATASLPSSGSLDYVPGQASTGAPTVAPAPSTAAPAAAPSARPTVRTRPAVLASPANSTATRVGQLAALGLVVAALMSYSRGYGLLGGKFAED